MMRANQYILMDRLNFMPHTGTYLHCKGLL